MCHKSRFVHHILCGESLYFKGFLRHTTPHFTAYYGVIFFANMGGGGGQKYFQISGDFFRRAQEGCGGLRGENPGAFPKAGPIFQQPFSLPENAQTLAGIAFRAAGKSAKNFPAASKIAGELFQQGISDSHSLLEFSDSYPH